MRSAGPFDTSAPRSRPPLADEQSVGYVDPAGSSSTTLPSPRDMETSGAEPVGSPTVTSADSPESARGSEGSALARATPYGARTRRRTAMQAYALLRKAIGKSREEDR